MDECPSRDAVKARFPLDCFAVQIRASRYVLLVFAYSLLQGQPAVKAAAHSRRAPSKLQFLCGVQAPYGEWNPLAQFISGLNSSAYSLSMDQKAAWTRHAELATASWANAQSHYLEPIDNWRDRTLEKSG